jgi:hypothetical protein
MPIMKRPDGSGSHPDSHSMGTGGGGVYAQEKSGRGVKLTTYLHPLSRLRMNGTITPLPIYLHGEHRDKFTYTSQRI